MSTPRTSFSTSVSPSPPHPSMTFVPQPSHLVQAARAVHDILKANGITHVFVGGFQMMIMGSSRDTYDVDIEMNKPSFLWNIERVATLFKGSDFETTIEANYHRVLIFHRSSGVDVKLTINRINNISKKFHYLPVGHNDDSPQLPFLQTSYLFVEKTKAAGERISRIDSDDLEFLYVNFRSDLNRDILCCKIWMYDILNAALRNHHTLHGPFKKLGLIIEDPRSNFI